MISTKIEILTEEYSMAKFLEGLLPRILPKEYILRENCFIRPHDGKSDLQKSIPIKMKAYPHFGYPVKVLIIHDQDSNDCQVLKNKLIELSHNSVNTVLVRIVCKELENWYLGDFDALEKVFPEIKSVRHKNKAKYRIPDNLSGAHELGLLSPNFGKSKAAIELGPIIDIQNNKSRSFQHFVTSLIKLISN